MVLASPKGWGLQCSWDAPSPTGSPGLSSGTLNLSHCPKPQLIFMTPSIPGLLCQLRLYLHQRHLLVSHSTSLCCCTWPLPAFKSRTRWKTIPYYQTYCQLHLDGADPRKHFPENFASMCCVFLVTADSSVSTDQCQPRKAKISLYRVPHGPPWENIGGIFKLYS